MIQTVLIVQITLISNLSRADDSVRNDQDAGQSSAFGGSILLSSIIVRYVTLTVFGKRTTRLDLSRFVRGHSAILHVPICCLRQIDPIIWQRVMLDTNTPPVNI